MYSLKLGALVYWEKWLRAIGGRKRKMEWGTKRKRQRESVWERKRWNGRVKQEREQERGREEEREYRPSVVFKCEAENHLCGSGEWRAIPVLDERVCRAWIIALSLSFALCLSYSVPEFSFRLQSEKTEELRVSTRRQYLDAGISGHLTMDGLRTKCWVLLQLCLNDTGTVVVSAVFFFCFFLCFLPSISMQLMR